MARALMRGSAQSRLGTSDAMLRGKSWYELLCLNYYKVLCAGLVCLQSCFRAWHLRVLCYLACMPYLSLALQSFCCRKSFAAGSHVNTVLVGFCSPEVLGGLLSFLASCELTCQIVDASSVKVLFGVVVP